MKETSGKALTEVMRQQAEHFGAEFLLAEVTELIFPVILRPYRPAAAHFSVLVYCLPPVRIRVRLDLPARTNFAGAV